MGKKKSRSKYTSRGERRNVSKSAVHAVRSTREFADKLLLKIKAWKKGQNPWINVNGVNIRSNDLYGNPKYINNISGAQPE